MLVWIVLAPLIGVLVNGVVFASGVWKKLLNGDEHTEKRIVSFVGCGVILASAILSTLAFLKLSLTDEKHIIQELFVWIPSGELKIGFEFLLDSLSCVMSLVVTWVSFLIHVYSIGYMHEDRSYSRYFTYLNMFVFFMLLLVLGNNFPLMFVGWEGVGLASYLLIGFWYEDAEKAYAGRKAFIVNRIGDFGFILGIFLIFFVFGSLNYQEVFSRALSPEFMDAIPQAVITTIALLLFVGAVGKSAQFPLYVWLPDAMAGPTPVSALIHAATMVTAGVYMIARCNVFYSQSPTAQMIVVGIATFTAFLAATIAITQNDIKKVLAYSTVSQLGYMFMGVGSGAYVAGMFHLVTHAFFKALLFLGSGSVIHALGGEQDIRKMGGLRRFLPVTSITFLIGTLAISGVPLFSGFFSKDEILGALYEKGYGICWFIALVTAVLTAFYMLRLYILTFEGKPRIPEDLKHHIHESPPSMLIPLIILAVLSVAGGYIGIPEFMWKSIGIEGENLFERFLSSSILSTEQVTHHALPHGSLTHWGLVALSVLAAFVGIALAVYMYAINPVLPERLTEKPIVSLLYRGSYGKWFVDEIYDLVFVKTFVNLSKLLALFDLKVIDGAVNGIAGAIRALASVLRTAQTGLLRFYAALMAIGVTAILVYMILSARF
ncbi:MAG: NADH-quinone oxidoreductase subunit L [Deltaproteobacteria bacterium]|jgi:NADH-quinone oxidoreductase subunit L|nr:MAG: NADH-quinone oxidoreductase subunit L [Deltaproteobacteria bacterium]